MKEVAAVISMWHKLYIWYAKGPPPWSLGWDTKQNVAVREAFNAAERRREK